jgi:hypothetical protein
LPNIPSSTSVRRVIDALSDAEHADDAWTDALKTLSDALNFAGSACIIFSRTTGRVDWACFSGLSAELESRYIDHYAALDPFSPLLDRTQEWTRLLDRLPASCLARSEWYNDFVLNCGVRDMIAAKLVHSSSHVGIVGLHQQIGRHSVHVDPAILHTVTDPLISATRRRVEAISLASGGPLAKTSVAGARYFFHICNGHSYVDTSGEVLASREEAASRAARLALELSHDEGWNGFEVCVTDETGLEIARMPIGGTEERM